MVIPAFVWTLVAVFGYLFTSFIAYGVMQYAFEGDEPKDGTELIGVVMAMCWPITLGCFTLYTLCNLFIEHVWDKFPNNLSYTIVRKVVEFFKRVFAKRKNKEPGFPILNTSTGNVRIEPVTAAEKYSEALAKREQLDREIEDLAVEAGVKKVYR